jgi:uncharacterized protein YerC
MSCALCADENEAGKLEERYRIMKLLENRTNDSGSVLDETGNSIADLSDLIELIKGETKPFITAAQVEQMADEMLEE